MLKILRKNNQGAVLIITVLITIMILFLGIYYLSFSLIEKKIGRSQSWGAKTYYLAEAGIQEMLYKLKNDPSYSNNFITIPDWSAVITRDNPFGPGSGSYAVGITNTSLAHGIIIATSTINLGNSHYAQRVIKTKVYRATGESFLNDIAGFGDHDLTVNGFISTLNFVNASVYASHDVKINGYTTVNIDKDLNAGHSYSKSIFSTVNIGGVIHTPSNPPPPAAVNIPAIDFDSSDPGSYKNLAGVIYTSAQFANLVRNNNNIVLNNAITYVDGDVDLYGAKSLTVNGLLVVKHDFIVGDHLCNGLSCGFSGVTVNHVSGTPSGILVKHKIDFEEWVGGIDIDGMIYSAQDFIINNLPSGYTFNITGAALAGHDLTINGFLRVVNIIQSSENISGIAGTTTFAPVITVEHWEEEY